MVSAFISIIFSLIFILSLSPTAYATIIDFEGYKSGTLIDDEYYEDLGVTFIPGGVITFQDLDAILSVGPEITAQFKDGISLNKVDVDYISSVNLTLEAYNASGILIDSVTTSPGNGSFGLSTNEMIRTVVIHDNGFDFAIDNFSFSVPEASTVTLLVSCLLGLCYVRRKAH
jgi:hypothetical protein